MTVQVGAPTPEQLVAELLAKQRAEAEEKHKREVAAWEAAQRAKFEEEVKAEKERIRRQYGYEPLSILLAQKYEYHARQQFESALAERKSAAQREFEESWRRFEESVKPSLLESARFWIGLGYPQYAGKYKPVELPEGAVVTKVYETPEGPRIEYKTREMIEAERRAEEERRRLEQIIRENREAWSRLGYPQYAEKYMAPSLPEGAVITKIEETPEGLRVQYKTREMLEAERQMEELIRRNREAWSRLGYPEYAEKYVAPSLPEGAVIVGIEETSVGLKIEYKTQEMLEVEKQIEELRKASEEFWTKMGHPELAGKYPPAQIPKDAVITRIEETEAGLAIEYMTKEQIEELKRIEKQIKASTEFWTKMGHPELAGKYAPVNLPPGAIITKIEETSEGLKIEYVTKEQMEQMKSLQQNIEKWRAFGMEEYAEYVFPSELTGYRIVGKTTLSSVGEVYVAYTEEQLKQLRAIEEYRRDIRKYGRTLPIADIDIPQPTYIKIVRTDEGLRITIFSQDQVEQIRQWVAGRDALKMDQTLYKAIRQARQDQLDTLKLDQTLYKTYKQMTQTETYTEKIEMKRYQEELEKAAQRRLELYQESVKFWTEVGLKEYAGKYEPIKELAGWQAAGYYYSSTLGELIILRRGQETYYAKFTEENGKLNIRLFTEGQIREVEKVYIPSLSYFLYQQAENINIPGLEEIIKSLVGAYAGLVDIPAAAIANLITQAAGGRIYITPGTALGTDIYYTAGAIAGGIGLSVLTMGTSMSLSKAAVLSLLGASIGAGATTVHSLITGRTPTLSEVAWGAYGGTVLTGITYTGYIALAGLLPATVYLHPVKSLIAQAGISSAISGATTYVLTGGDVQRTLMAMGLSAGVALAIGAAVRWGPEAFVYLKEWFKVELAGKIKRATEFEYGRITPEDLVLKRETFLDVELKRAPKDVLDYLKQLEYQTVRLGGKEIAQTVAASKEMGYFEYGVRAGQAEAFRPAEPYVHAIRGERYLHGFGLAEGGHTAIKLSAADLGRVSERFMVKGDMGAVVNIAELSVREYTGAFFEATIDPKIYLEILRKLGSDALKWFPQIGGLTAQQITQLPAGTMIRIAPEFTPIATPAVLTPIVIARPQGEKETKWIDVELIVSPTVQGTVGAVKPLKPSIQEIVTKPADSEIPVNLLHAPRMVPLVERVENITAIKALEKNENIKLLSERLEKTVETSMFTETLKEILVKGVAAETYVREATLTTATEIYAKETAVSSALETYVKEALNQVNVLSRELVAPTPVTPSPSPSPTPTVKTFGEYSLPLFMRRGRVLGFIYERTRPITGAEEQLKRIKRELKVDPHVFLEASSPPAKRKVKASLTEIGTGETRPLTARLHLNVAPVHVGRRREGGQVHFSITGLPSIGEGLRRMRRQVAAGFRKPTDITLKQDVRALLRGILGEEERKKKKKKEK